MLVVLAVFSGAAAGALLHPSADDRFRAEAVLAIESSPTSSLERREAAWRRVAAAVRLPVVLSAANRAIGAQDGGSSLAGRVSALGDPRSSLVRVRARATSQEQADRLADAATRVAIETATRASTGPPVRATPNTAFDFETSREGWGRARSAFNLPPRSVTLQRGGARSGRQSLRVECPQNKDGCGPAVVVDAAFNRGTAYTATAYARKPAGRSARLRMVMGANPADLATGRYVVVSRRWMPLRVRWTPQRSDFSAEIGLQAAGGAATFNVDGVELFDRTTSSASVRAERRLAVKRRAERAALADRYTILARAEAVDAVELPTARSALLGAGFGLTVALGGLLASHLARRRHREP